ncbi:hypothetical protein CDIK_1897 [Cucumispora dikerogammari]|nr:hypothetical protein CDIK_1897 [Cucumispora dikerogammari]
MCIVRSTNNFFVSLKKPPTHHEAFNTRFLLFFLLLRAVSSNSTISSIPPIFSILRGTTTLLITEITALMAFYSTLNSCFIRFITVCWTHSNIIIITLKSGNFKSLKKESVLIDFLYFLHFDFQQTQIHPSSR